MNAEEQKQRQQGAEIILDRCKRFARELGVELKGAKWKDDLKNARDVYILVVDLGSGIDEIPLSHTELQAYSARTSTTGTDEKLKSVIQKRPSGS